ncbi:hypothetical protein ACXWR7_12970, partial [Streptococcus pyogenes]
PPLPSLSSPLFFSPSPPSSSFSSLPSPSLPLSFLFSPLSPFLSSSLLSLSSPFPPLLSLPFSLLFPFLSLSFFFFFFF